MRLESGDPITRLSTLWPSPLATRWPFPPSSICWIWPTSPSTPRTAPDLTPLVIAGGTAMYNAEPLADFIDLVSLGEGEDVTVELVELHRRARREGWSKAQFSPRRCPTATVSMSRPFTM